jgi:aryl-alcohol dehydrogenase-like predicted oxidoreductase
MAVQFRPGVPPRYRTAFEELVSDRTVLDLTPTTMPTMIELRSRRLGQSDLELSPIGIGTAPIGSTQDWEIYWGRQDVGEAIRAIHAAIDDGVNWIDTAPFYGWGRAEEIVGEAIRGRRDRVFVFTKCGTMRAPSGESFMDLSPEAIRRDTHASLERLGVEHIDLLQPHDLDERVPIEESWGEVQRLIAEGKVRYGGLSNHGVDLMRRALSIGPVVAAQHRFNLLSRDIERDVLPFCHQAGVGMLSWGSLGEGLLAEGFDLDGLEPNDFRRSRPNFQEPRYSRIRALVSELTGMASLHSRNASDLAIAWLLSRPGMTGAIVGIRSAEEAHALARAGDWDLPEPLVERVERALIRFDQA